MNGSKSSERVFSRSISEFQYEGRFCRAVNIRARLVGGAKKRKKRPQRKAASQTSVSDDNFSLDTEDHLYLPRRHRFKMVCSSVLSAIILFDPDFLGPLRCSGNPGREERPRPRLLPPRELQEHPRGRPGHQWHEVAARPRFPRQCHQQDGGCADEEVHPWHWPHCSG